MFRASAFSMLPMVLLLAACNSNQPAPPDYSQITAINSFGANPNPAPANVAVNFSWSVTGANLTCQLDVDNNGTVDYTIENCSTSSRASHVYGKQGSFDARLTVSGTDGKTVQRSTPVNISAPNSPPTIPSLTPAPPASSKDPFAVQFTWVVADFDADITHCKFDAESDGVWDFDDLCSGLPTSSSAGKTSTVSFTYTHSYGKKGQFKATLEAADPHVTTQTQVSVRVPWNRAPIITKLTATPGNNNTAEISFSVSDPDNDRLSCLLTVGSIGKFSIPNCSSGVRNYRFGGEGSYPVTLTVNDGLGGTASLTRTVTFKSLSKPVKTVSLSSVYACALDFDGITYCWGNNDDGQLGNGTFSSTNTPTRVQTDLRFTSISVGYYHTCALTEAGEAYCWGKNNYGQLGDGNGAYQDEPLPVKVTGGLVFKQIAAGGDSSSTCGLTIEEDVWCWGGGENGILGQKDDNYPSESLIPVKVVAGGTKFIQIAMGYYHICGITSGGDTYCWGYNDYGEIGIDPDGTPNQADGNSNDPEYFDSPQQVAQSYDFTSILVGYFITCGSTLAKEFYCWGYGSNGALGNGADDDSYTPVQAASGFPFEQIYGGGSSGERVCGIKADGETWCWGYASNGALGNGSTDNANTPQLVQDHKFRMIATGEYNTCGITLDDRLMCWGTGFYGVLGNGTNSDATTPVQVNPLP